MPGKNDHRVWCSDLHVALRCVPCVLYSIPKWWTVHIYKILYICYYGERQLWFKSNAYTVCVFCAFLYVVFRREATVECGGTSHKQTASESFEYACVNTHVQATAYYVQIPYIPMWSNFTQKDCEQIACETRSNQQIAWLMTVGCYRLRGSWPWAAIDCVAHDRGLL